MQMNANAHTRNGDNEERLVKIGENAIPRVIIGEN